MSSNWLRVIEWLDVGEAFSREVKRIYFMEKTDFQSIAVLEVLPHGKVLIIDGKTQSALVDEWIYHEALVHPAMISHPEPREVLILGGGEGATLREVLKHKTVKKVIMVDIDKKMIEIARKYLYEWHQGAFDDNRVNVVIEDGRRFLGESQSKYDIIIVDLTDPLKDSSSMYLYTKEFYELIYNALKDDGIFVTQSTQIALSVDVYAVIHSTISSVFPISRLYHTFVPSFLLDWSFNIGSKKHDPITLSGEEIDSRIRERIIGDLKFYDSETHKHMFSMPKHVRRVLNSTKKISTDAEPIYLPI